MLLLLLYNAARKITKIRLHNLSENLSRFVLVFFLCLFSYLALCSAHKVVCFLFCVGRVQLNGRADGRWREGDDSARPRNS